MKYDVIIAGAGPAGIFTAYELIKKDKNTKILMIEKGNSIKDRICPKRSHSKCMQCNPCNITTGFAGAGAYSDGKLSLCADVGGILPEFIGYEKTKELIEYVDNIYLSYGADKKVHGLKNTELMKSIKRKAIESNLKLVNCPVRHLGTEEAYRIYSLLEKYLLDHGVEILFNTAVSDLLIESGELKGVQLKENEFFYSDKVVAAVGREGSEWLKKICGKHKILTAVGTIDIGIRIEMRNEIMEELNSLMYETKLIYYTPTFDDKVRTFCTNPSGTVAAEYYDGRLATVNGHAYKADNMKTNNTNFALLVSMNFTEPFNSPIEYAKHIAQLGNMLSGGKILVQRYGDFKRGRRTTQERLYRNNIVPTLKDAVPGDLSLVLPYRLMKDIDEMLIALDKLTPGVASDETLLYGVEAKFYSNKLSLTKDFETNIKGLYGIGDGAGVTRGLMMASCNGVQIARVISRGEKNAIN
jgi:uncharacterized protein